jgi:cell division protein FtsI (penicillin-binding protein 3)
MNKYLNIVDIPPVDGCDIITTIDVGMQDIAEKALLDQLKEIGGNVGVAILMEVKTGEVKAIVNMTKGSDGIYREMKNNAVSDMMEPGSTFKTASIMVALEDGYITPDQLVDTKNGVYMMHGRPMKDHNWHRGGYGVIDITKVLMVSSNIGVSRVIDENYQHQPEKYVEGLYKLGIATPLELDIPGAAKKPYIRKPTKENWYKTALPWMSIGYETQVPPMNTLAFYNAIANGGVMVKPKFVRSIVKDGEVVEEIPTEVLNPAIASPKTIEQIQTILEKVVSEGLGKPAGSKQFHVSGKTGTAQVSKGSGGYKTGQMQYLVSFCGYFPSEEPKYSCIVAIQKSGLPASGGLMAGSVFSEIAERVYAKYLAQDLEEAKDSTSILTPDVKHGDMAAARYILDKIDIETIGMDKADENKPVWGNVTHNPNQNITLTPKAIDEKKVPKVIGMGAKDAVFLLENMGLKVHLSGIGKVRSQSIPPGNTLVKGKTIQLKLQ